ncbi:hypothetical protein IWW50_001924 [Coemansia erecta]|nr:hypothetical protein IWW50_001924 [Coemansia erecta]
MERMRISDSSAIPTPAKPSTGHPRSISTGQCTGASFNPTGSQTNDKYPEASMQVAYYLKDDITGLQSMASPDTRIADKHVNEQAKSITGFIDSLVDCVDVGADANTVKTKVWRTIDAELKHRTSAGQHSRATDSGLADLAMQFLPWLCPDSRICLTSTSEKKIYPCLLGLIDFVAECILRPELPASTSQRPQRLIRPYELTDRKPDYSEGKSRVDIALKCDVLDDDITGDNGYGSDSFQIPKDKLHTGNPGRPTYPRMFAIVEAKPDTSDSNMRKGFAQLVEYSKGIYWTQHNRRFLWGIVSGGSMVKVCVLGPNFILASPFMDVTTSEGRMELITQLVSWSFCELHKLGYDPTIRFNRKHKCVTIDMDYIVNSDGSEQAQKTYYLRKIVVFAERIFGRHTRCFVASEQPPSARDSSGDILIKDAWPEANELEAEDTRDESKHLEAITNGLKGHDDVKGMYPGFVGGGRVKLLGARGEIFEDTTRTVVGDEVWNQMDGVALRVHKRIAMRGVGEPLKSLRSIPELIVVIRDVMRCHAAILKHCRILHRDISEGNILVRRDDTGVHGMLIDFDHAIDITDQGYAKRTERTGTLPYMSIGNLENSETERTALDDWESIIYMLCWIGTFGWNSKTRRAAPDPDMDINNWKNGSIKMIARAKRSFMNTRDNFMPIVMDFNSDIEHIGALRLTVERLRATLIDKHAPELTGAIIKSVDKAQVLDSDDVFGVYESFEVVDPFEKRAPHWETISDRLLAQLERITDSFQKHL